MSERMKLSTIRAMPQFAPYEAMGDDELLMNIRQTFYKNVPPGEFYNRIDYDTQRAKLQDEAAAEQGFFGNLAAGNTKSLHDLGRTAKRIGNMFGIGDYDQKAAEEDQQLDEGLMRTSGGTAGKIFGDITNTALPGFGVAAGTTKAIVKGAQMAQGAKSVLPRALGYVVETAAPYLGAATGGAATGAALSPADMSGGAATGAVAGLVGEGLGRVGSAAYGGAKAIVEPLWQGGRERILKRTLDRFATDPAKARAAAAASRELVPGAQPTLAEATMDPGLAQLQRSSQSMPEVAAAMAEAKSQRLNAYKTVLDELAGTGGQRAFYEADRAAAAKLLYDKAYAEGLQMTPELEKQFARLMTRPSIKSAIPKARQLAAEKGMNISRKPGGSVQGLDWIKQSLDDMISKASTAGANKEAAAIGSTKDELLGAVSKASPAYGEAVETYRQMSRPINQMEIGQTLRDKLFPALSDFSGDLQRSRANSYAEALRNSGQTAKGATGMGNATIENVLDPAQLQAVQGIGQDLGRQAAAQELGALPGSQTAQHLGATNILRQFLGPLGLPQSALDSTLTSTLAGIASLPFKLTGSQTQQLLADALRDPRVAARLMQVKDNPTLIAKLLQPYAAQLSIQTGAH